MDKKRKIRIRRALRKVDAKVIAPEKTPAKRNVSITILVLFILSASIPAGRLEKAQHKVTIRVSIPTAV